MARQALAPRFRFVEQDVQAFLDCRPEFKCHARQPAALPHRPLHALATRAGTEVGTSDEICDLCGRRVSEPLRPEPKPEKEKAEESSRKSETSSGTLEPPEKCNSPRASRRCRALPNSHFRLFALSCIVLPLRDTTMTPNSASLASTDDSGDLHNNLLFSQSVTMKSAASILVLVLVEDIMLMPTLRKRPKEATPPSRSVSEQQLQNARFAAEPSIGSSSAEWL